MARGVGPSRIYPQARRLAAGPWVGVRDATDPVVSAGGVGEGDGANFLLSAINMYLAAGPFGRAWIGRPGITPMLDDVEDDILGSSGKRTGQALYTWTKENGTRITIGICGGQFYTYDWTTNAWTETLDAADLSGASVALSETSRVALVPFAGVLVISDGVNKPWTWDGVNAAGITAMPNAPVFYGPPKVYYAKLCGIKAAERNTWVWSEEADPYNGYEAGGYNNAWTLGQATNANILTAIEATNEALVFFRERACTTVTGALNEDFETTGTRASVDETIGSASPWAVRVLSSVVFAPDAEARPHGVILGTHLQPLWSDCEVTARGVIRGSLANAVTVRFLQCNVALMAVGLSSNTLDACMVFDLTSGQYQGLWSGWSMDILGELVDDSGNPRVGMFDNATGIPMLFELPASAAYNDALPTGTVNVQHSVKPRFLFRDLDREITVDKIGFGIGTTGTTSCSIGYETTRGIFDPLSVSLDANGSGGVYGTALYGTDVFAGEMKDRRAEVGCIGQGRWVVPEFRHSVPSETCSVTDCRVVGFESGADTDIP